MHRSLERSTPVQNKKHKSGQRKTDNGKLNKTIAFFVVCSVHRAEKSLPTGTENPQSIHPDKTYSGVTKAKDIQRHPLEHTRTLLRSGDRIRSHDNHGAYPHPLIGISNGKCISLTTYNTIG